MNTKAMTLEEMQLVKRTAWVNMQPRKPAPQDEVYVAHAIKMLTYIAALDSMLYELVWELNDVRLYSHNIKRRVTQVHDMVRQVHTQSYRMLNAVSPNAGRQYNDAMDRECSNICECVLLKTPERAYNIVLALCRLIEKSNKEIAPRYDYAPAYKLSKIPSLLDVIPLKDHHIDNIIELNYKR